MNYSKDSRKKANESTDATQTKKKKSKKKAKVSILRVFLILMIISIFAVAGAGLGIFLGIIKSAPDITTLELKPTTDFTSFIYDQNGQEIDRLSGGENRIYVTLDEIPKHFQEAVIAIEDERFMEHHGIDIRGIFRALMANLKSGKFDQGASTITQQLIKNNVLTPDKTITRKVQEQYLALQFEKVYSKELILEYYLNTIHLGDGEYGVQAAANYYFNKDASELTLAESAVLASIPKATTTFNPKRNPETNWERAQVVLNQMEKLNFITAEEKALALAENPYENIAEIHQNLDTDSKHSYFVDAVTEQVIKDLQTELGLTKVQANNMIYSGGLQIYTTLDQEIQKIVDTHMANPDLFPTHVEYVIEYAASIRKADGTEVHRGGGKTVLKSDNEEELQKFKDAQLKEWGFVEGDTAFNEVIHVIPQTQAAFIISDQYTGHIKALSGGRGEKFTDRAFNRATQAMRQPGSTFKVLASYAAALDTGVLSPGSVIVDEPYTVDKYTPKNWYSGYRGPSTVRQGIYDSMNIVAVKALEQVGLNTAYDYLLNFGFTTLTETGDKYYPLTLGGLSKGVTPLELNAAYATIANLGTYVEPILYTKVMDMDGNVLLDNSVPETRTVIKESTASMLTDMMEDTIQRGTAGTVKSTFYNATKMPIAGKTGTTSDNKDFLFAGYTPYYTATVWMGYDTPQPFNIGKPQRHQLLWGTIMKDVHEAKEIKPFEKVTTGYTKTTICADSGKLPTDLCRLDPNHVIVSDYFNKNHTPNDYCDVHAEVKVCTVSGKIATEFCPPESVQSQVSTRPSSGDSAVDASDLCDVHTATPLPPEGGGIGWPEWPDWMLPGGNQGGNNSNGDTGITTPTPETPVVPETPDEIAPPTPVPPTPSPDEDNGFYIPQG
ncbi:MAG: transglycosylase domain-containing protein [Cellulosilyticaceae bacterium]